MKEEKVFKNRKWVIRVAIVFMAAMLLLLFFSNTIYNYSLPQVTVVYSSPGQMTTAIRESGTIEAMKSTKVISDGTHTIEDIPVTLYDEVTAGDPLVVFKAIDPKDNEELKTAQEALDGLLRQEYTDNLKATERDYTTFERDIADKLEALNLANENLTKAQGKAAAVSAAQADVDARKTELDARNAEMATIKMQEDALMAAYGTAQDDFNEEDLIMAPLVSKLEVNKAILIAAQGELDAANGDLKTKEEAKNTAAAALAEAQKAYDDAVKNSGDVAKAKAALDAAKVTYNQAEKAFTDAQKVVTDKTTARDAAQVDVDNAQTAVDDRQPAWDLAKSVLDKASADLEAYAQTVNAKQAEVDAATKALTDAETKLTEANSLPSVEDAADLVEISQRNYDDAVKTFDKQKKDDGIQDILDSLTDADAKKAIEEAKKKVDDLKAVLEKTTIIAPVSGKVSQINITEGTDTVKGDTLFVIDEVDEGYKVVLTFTAEQVTKGQMVVGMGARDDNYGYGGSEEDAFIVSIKPDPTDPRKLKKVTFKLNSENEFGDWYYSGQSITLSMNNRSQSYQCIVPLSATHVESGGETFVYTIKINNSPLGDRYVAIKVPVTILARDEQNAAINPDALSEWGSQVITQSNKSFESGDQVRLAES